MFTFSLNSLLRGGGIICILETKIDAKSNVSVWKKLGNIRETCTRSNAQRIFLETDRTIEADVRKGSSHEASAKIESYL